MYDIVGRTKSADKKAFMDVSLYILANAGKELSIDNIIETYKKENRENMTEESFKDYLSVRLNNSHVSLSKKEKDTFFDNLLGSLKESELFSWIFEKQ